MTPIRIPDALDALTRFTAGLRWEDVPGDVQAKAALILLDDLAAMVAARAEPELIALRAGLGHSAGPGGASVFDGSGQRVDRYSAALGNGSAADWCELDGGFRAIVCHAALYCLPALMAEAEDTGRSLRDLLLALIAGYETIARVALAFPFPSLTLHPHGALATIGAAAAIAKLRGHAPTLAAAAIQSSATMVLPGPFTHAVTGALVRNVWPGLCAQAGIRAVDWAEIGIGGTDESLSLVLQGLFGAQPDPARLAADLGSDWMIRQGYHKLHACCQYGHSTVEAVIAALRPVGRVAAEAIERIELDLHPLALKLDNADPATTLATKFSMQHIAAATATFGAAGAEAFHARTLSDPALAALRHRVVLRPFGAILPPPDDRPARVRIVMADGRDFAAECLSAQGGADRPFSTEAIAGKAAANLGPAYPGADRLVARLVAGESAVLDQSWAALVRDLSQG